MMVVIVVVVVMVVMVSKGVTSPPFIIVILPFGPTPLLEFQKFGPPLFITSPHLVEFS